MSRHTNSSCPSTLRDIWALLPGNVPDFERDVSVGPTLLQSAFDVDELARSTTAAASLAIRELGTGRGPVAKTVEIDGAITRAAFATYLTIDGVVPPTWADLSGYYETGDGRTVQFHCNFEHHAAGVVELLGCAADRAAVEEAVRSWDADELEAALISRGMIAAKLRTLPEWDAHPHALATRALPLLEMEQIGDAAPRALRNLRGVSKRDESGVANERPLDGVRVLDCSRVLAGPVGAQVLAAHGADVLRVSAPHLPAVPMCVQATGAGKRNAFVDLDSASGRDTFSSLLSSTDVWIDAYRPRAFQDRGFSASHAAERSPGIVVVQLSAFDWVGPWAGRRGFDSIVQSTTGIVDAGSEFSQSEQPRPLPVQALDHATGQLAAFAAARALQHQRQHGGSWRVRLSLLRTRNWLVGLRSPTSFSHAVPTIDPLSLYEVDSSWGRLGLPKPPSGSVSSSPQPLGSSTAEWLPR